MARNGRKTAIFVSRKFWFTVSRYHWGPLSHFAVFLSWLFFNSFRSKFCSHKAVSFAYYAITLPFSLTICKSKSITPVSSFKPPEELSFPQKVFRSSSINLTSTQKFFNDSPGKQSCFKASKINFFLEGYKKFDMFWENLQIQDHFHYKKKSIHFFQDFTLYNLGYFQLRIAWKSAESTPKLYQVLRMNWLLHLEVSQITCFPNLNVFYSLGMLKVAF